MADIKVPWSTLLNAGDRDNQSVLIKLIDNGDGSYSLSTSSSGAGGGITSLSPVLGSAVNSTNEIDIFNQSIPASSWADGEEICVERFYLRGTYNPPATYTLRIYVGAVKIFEVSTKQPSGLYPAYGYDGYAFMVRRIGNDIWVLNQNNNAGAFALESFTNSSSYPGNGSRAFGDGSNKFATLGSGLLFSSNFTLAQDIRVTIQWSAANPLNEITALSANVWKFPADGGVSNGTYVGLSALTGAINGVNDTFTFPSTPFSTTPVIYYNGLEQDPSLYSLVGNTAVFASAPIPSGSGDDHIYATYWHSGQEPYYYPSVALTGVIDGLNANFVFPITPVVGSETVWFNGLEQDPADYSIVGTTLTFTTPPQPSGGTDLMTAQFYRNAQPAKYIPNEIPTGAVDGSNATFTFANTISGNTMVLTVNGITQFPTLHYTVSGAVVTMLTAPLAGDVIRGSYWKV